MRNKKANIPDISKMFTCAGDPDHINYEPIVEKDGTITLTPSGKTNIPELINSYKETTDMAYIMKRMTMGDLSMFRADGMYGDFRDMPRDPAEVLQYQINAERYFYNLPPDIRNKFNNSVTEFLREGQNESEFFFKALGVEKKSEVTESAESSD